MLEILTISLRKGTRDKFHQVYINESIPLQKKWKLDVVAHGPSQHDEDTYYVIRRFGSVEEMKSKTEAFYKSDEWQQGPRTAILSLVENISYLLVPEETITDLIKRLGLVQ